MVFPALLPLYPSFFCIQMRRPRLQQPLCNPKATLRWTWDWTGMMETRWTKNTKETWDTDIIATIFSTLGDDSDNFCSMSKATLLFYDHWYEHHRKHQSSTLSSSFSFLYFAYWTYVHILSILCMCLRMCYFLLSVSTCICDKRRPHLGQSQMQ